MTPWDKTLSNFKAKKASGDPYWEAGEMVPIHELEPYREYNRKTQPKYPGHFDDVKAYIQQHGIDDMGILSYNPGTHRVYQSEGNTRLAVAKELGFSHVPVRVYRSGHEKRAGGIAPRGWDPSVRGRCPADIKPSQIGFTALRTEGTMDENDISVTLREAQRFLDEDDSFMSKVGSAISQGASNLYTGLRDTGKALFSAPKPSAGPSVFGSTASDAFKAVKDAVSAPGAVKSALSTTLNKAATSAASTPMHNSVQRMINQIAEGTFDWQELDRLYGSDFKDVSTPKGKEVAQVHPGYEDVADLLVHHGYMPHPADKGRGSVEYHHPDGHTVDVDTKNLEWNHYQRGSGAGFHGAVPSWTAAGRGIGDLDDHLRSFHRAW